MFVNLTKRRSFVKDLTEVGFYEVKTVSEFEELLAQWIQNPDRARKEMNRAIEMFNDNY